MKLLLRTYALGLLTATLIIGFYYFYFTEQDVLIEKVEMTEPEMVDKLVDAGFYVFESDPTEIKEDEQHQTESDQADPDQGDDDQSKTDNSDEASTQSESNNSFILTIEPGMTVTQVAEYLVAAELIADRSELANYLVNNGYGTNIQIGQFELDRAMTLAEIVELIAKRD